MKITDTHVSIPPYISTTWENIAALHTDKGVLIFSLVDGSDIEVPHLSKEKIEEIFAHHEHFLEEQKEEEPQHPLFEAFSKDAALMHLGGLEAIGEALSHNPKNAHMAPIPEEMAKKIEAMARLMSEDELELVEPPEDDCMCLYCQIARHLLQAHGEIENSIITNEEPVSAEELRFEQWAVEYVSDKMYRVSNKLDKTEVYTVFLGEPIGCTCGKPKCEHVVAALRS